MYNSNFLDIFIREEWKHLDWFRNTQAGYIEIVDFFERKSVLLQQDRSWLAFWTFDASGSF